MSNKKQIIVFNTKEMLVEAAQEQSNKVDQNYQQSTYLYFIARYFVSVFESRYGVIPVQVWNEYRNALDHFFRHQTNNSSKQTGNADGNIPRQLLKMEGHIQRAALDIMKIHCHRTKDSVAQVKNNFKPEVLQLVDNGKFYTDLITETNRAEGLFEKAKIYDNNLGETARLDKEVLNKYLEAVFAFDELKIELINKAADLEVANNNYNSIHDNASKGSTKHHYFIHFTFYIFWSIFISFCTLMWNEQLEPVYKKVFSNLVADNHKVVLGNLGISTKQLPDINYS
ncbi:hypothetical protein bplSymb_SCF08803P002 [Bathymodiolus platifrons methanotrophic gill symbiont]|uniref:hypothetical protein n=1 Tax=Bathymodiolus platifrons methanotrophic gill symbiont TaxID=113268 RepID=UPI000B4188BA|nr:hypothetical protein [Bathymodiolus platifrons methanotrophic gill symbiont]GAW87457.1 hypothetical protein bplSymb_SCF08803P002 [Bathymodiolus platifrons methanotrophic gill symbiont]